MNNKTTLYKNAQTLAFDLEQELKRLGRWSAEPLPEERFENMGAFGSNTMTFEQWLQFVLIPSIHSIVEEKGEFPDESNLAAYAIRNFDGDPDAGGLHDILYKLDDLVNGVENEIVEPLPITQGTNTSVSMGGETIPDVLFTLAGLLPECKAENLESQLQTFDAFLSYLSPKVRPKISSMIMDAASHSQEPSRKLRLEQAAIEVGKGGRAAPPYNHAEAMKKYIEDHKKNFPSQDDPA